MVIRSLSREELYFVALERVEGFVFGFLNDLRSAECNQGRSIPQPDTNLVEVELKSK